MRGGRVGSPACPRRLAGAEHLSCRGAPDADPTPPGAHARGARLPALAAGDAVGVARPGRGPAGHPRGRPCGGARRRARPVRRHAGRRQRRGAGAVPSTCSALDCRHPAGRAGGAHRLPGELPARRGHAARRGVGREDAQRGGPRRRPARGGVDRLRLLRRPEVQPLRRRRVPARPHDGRLADRRAGRHAQDRGVRRGELAVRRLSALGLVLGGLTRSRGARGARGARGERHDNRAPVRVRCRGAFSCMEQSA